MKALIFNIQRYSIHDGDGIRTIVFFKGCPLRCPWCSNVESQSFKIETGKIKERCLNCTICSKDAIECPSGALVDFGKWMTIDEVIEEVMKDSIFYMTSGGGVTLSGGEVLSQASFAAELLKRLKEGGINTAIETCGEGKSDDLIKMSDYLDLVLFDLKIMDETKAKSLLNADVKTIMKNIEYLVSNKIRVIPRVPLIPKYTMDFQNIKSIADYVLKLSLNEIHILPFHQYGSNKYEFLNKKYDLKDLKPPSPSDIENIKNYFENRGLKVVVGGL